MRFPCGRITPEYAEAKVLANCVIGDFDSHRRRRYCRVVQHRH